jgi:hypothetical protein
VDDPAVVQGSESERLRAFRDVCQVLQTRIRLFTSLRLELLDRLALRGELGKIGETESG